MAAALLIGAAGSTQNATVLIYSAQEQNVTVNNQSTSVGPYVAHIPVEIILPAGKHTQYIHVHSAAMTYDLPITTVGKRSWRWLWCLLAVPFALIVYAVRLRRGAGSS